MDWTSLNYIDKDISFEDLISFAQDTSTRRVSFNSFKDGELEKNDYYSAVVTRGIESIKEAITKVALIHFNNQIVLESSESTDTVEEVIDAAKETIRAAFIKELKEIDESVSKSVDRIKDWSSRKKHVQDHNENLLQEHPFYFRFLVNVARAMPKVLFGESKTHNIKILRSDLALYHLANWAKSSLKYLETDEPAVKVLLQDTEVLDLFEAAIESLESLVLATREDLMIMGNRMEIMYFPKRSKARLKKESAEASATQSAV